MVGVHLLHVHRAPLDIEPNAGITLLSGFVLPPLMAHAVASDDAEVAA